MTFIAHIALGCLSYLLYAGNPAEGMESDYWVQPQSDQAFWLNRDGQVQPATQHLTLGPRDSFFCFVPNLQTFHLQLQDAEHDQIELATSQSGWAFTSLPISWLEGNRASLASNGAWFRIRVKQTCSFQFGITTDPIPVPPAVFSTIKVDLEQKNVAFPNQNRKDTYSFLPAGETLRFQVAKGEKNLVHMRRWYDPSRSLQAQNRGFIWAENGSNQEVYWLETAPILQEPVEIDGHSAIIGRLEGWEIPTSQHAETWTFRCSVPLLIQIHSQQGYRLNPELNPSQHSLLDWAQLQPFTLWQADIQDLAPAAQSQKRLIPATDPRQTNLQFLINRESYYRTPAPSHAEALVWQAFPTQTLVYHGQELGALCLGRLWDERETNKFLVRMAPGQVLNYALPNTTHDLNLRWIALSEPGLRGTLRVSGTQSQSWQIEAPQGWPEAAVPCLDPLLSETQPAVCPVAVMSESFSSAKRPKALHVEWLPSNTQPLWLTLEVRLPKPFRVDEATFRSLSRLGLGPNLSVLNAEGSTDSTSNPNLWSSHFAPLQKRLAHMAQAFNGEPCGELLAGPLSSPDPNDLQMTSFSNPNLDQLAQNAWLARLSHDPQRQLFLALDLWQEQEYFLAESILKALFTASGQASEDAANALMALYRDQNRTDDLQGLYAAYFQATGSTEVLAQLAESWSEEGQTQWAFDLYLLLAHQCPENAWRSALAEGWFLWADDVRAAINDQDLQQRLIWETAHQQGLPVPPNSNPPLKPLAFSSFQPLSTGRVSAPQLAWVYNDSLRLFSDFWQIDKDHPLQFEPEEAGTYQLEIRPILEAQQSVVSGFYAWSWGDQRATGKLDQVGASPSLSLLTQPENGVGQAQFQILHLNPHHFLELQCDVPLLIRIRQCQSNLDTRTYPTPYAPERLWVSHSDAVPPSREGTAFHPSDGQWENAFRELFLGETPPEPDTNAPLKQRVAEFLRQHHADWADSGPQIVRFLKANPDLLAREQQDIAAPLLNWGTWDLCGDISGGMGSAWLSHSPPNPAYERRKALMAIGAQEVLLSREQSLSVQFDAGAERSLTLSCAVDTPNPLESDAVHVRLSWSNGLTEQRWIYPGPRQPLLLHAPKGATWCNLEVPWAFLNQFVRVLVMNAAGEPIPFPPVKRLFQAVGPDAPLWLSIAEPTRLQIEKWQDNRVSLEELWITEPGQIQMGSDQMAWVRVSRRSWAKASEARLRLETEPSPVSQHQTLTFEPTYPVPFSTMPSLFSNAVEVEFVTRERSDQNDDRFAGRDVFSQLEAQANRSYFQRQLFLKAKMLYRKRSNDADTLGLQLGIEAHRFNHQLELDFRAFRQHLPPYILDDGYARQFEDPTTYRTELTWRPPRRAWNAWQWRPELSFFYSYLDMQVEPPGPLDWDVYTDYKRDHQNGLVWRDSLRWAHAADWFSRAEVAIFSNPLDQQEDPVDQIHMAVSTTILWADTQWEPELFTRFALKDPNRDERYSDWAGSLLVGFQRWEANNTRRQARIKMTYYPAQNALNFSLSFLFGPQVRGSFWDYSDQDLAYQNYLESRRQWLDQKCQ
ncbi:MAG: hypothetical protein KDC71_08795 [Acidobacteria bacterium]|nr:hypothetical protein [Acidobacteriota bacterium]